MDEEVVLLLEDKAAYLVDDPNGYQQASSEQVVEWNKKLLNESPREAPSSSKDSEKQKLANSEAAIAKRLARQKKKEADKSIQEESLLTPEPQAESPGIDETPEVEQRFPITRQSSTLPWFSSDGHTYKTLSEGKEAGIWTYPSTPFQRARCTVFRHLWAQGNYLGMGIKFGGDFVVYPGDPLRYHSHFVATVHFKHAPLRPMEIIAHGRLGTGTRKNHLICSVDEETYEVECFSVEWSGFG